MAKDILDRTIWQPTHWEKIFTNCTSDRVLISNIFKERSKLDFKEPNIPNKKWSGELNREVSTEEY